jgi:hypothetical protein
VAVRQVIISASSGRVRADDDRWGAQIDDLYRILHEDLPSAVHKNGTAEAGTKGSVESIIVALGGAGVVKALVDCFKAWIDREQTRRVTVTWTANGETRSVTVDSTAVGPAMIERLTEELVGKLSDER